MSFDVLIQGKLKGGVTVRSSKSGRPFATFKLSTTDKANNQLWISAITFSESAIAVLEQLKEGDAVAISGESTISTWQANDGTTRYGLDVTAHQAMSAYHAGRKRGTNNREVNQSWAQAAPASTARNMPMPPSQEDKEMLALLESVE